MKIRVFLAGSLILLGSAASARDPLSVSLEAVSEPTDFSLTTERIWELDPGESRPHRARWIVQRGIEIMGLRPIPVAQKRFSVTADSVRSKSRVHLRGPGPWYVKFDEFRCEPEPSDWFETREGAEKAATAAEVAWRGLLAERMTRLSVHLEHVSEKTEGSALLKGQQIFARWLLESESEWRSRSLRKARIAEWRSYLEAGTSDGICKPGKRSQKASEPGPAWEALMEPPAASAEGPKLLARAPARQWSGLFSIRVSARVGDVRVLGQFLIDSGAAQSVLSPSWLETQGVNPARIELPGGPGLTRRASVHSVEISGLKVPMTEFLLLETDFFGPPEHASGCCDGILGADFLRLYAVEFSPAIPTEVRIWDRRGFSGTKDSRRWIEVAYDPAKGLASACQATSAHSSTAPAASLAGVRWDTGSEAALELPPPWRDRLKSGGTEWKLACGPLLIGEGLPAIAAREREGGDGPFASKDPSMNLGMELLGRGKFALDLPHGRIWFSEEGLRKPVLVNRSGLKARFLRQNDDRVLKVVEIAPDSPAESLSRAGLKRGMEITRIDAIAADELDQWDVDGRLAGVHGDTVTLEWKTREGVKLAPLTLKIREKQK